MFEIKIVSFGYKAGDAPQSNLLFDVRFLDNPFWVAELRGKTGLEKSVQEYVLIQPLAKNFLEKLLTLLSEVLPAMLLKKAKIMTIAFGCTGGQHRSVSIAEEVSRSLRRQFPDYKINVYHRELTEQGRV